MLHSLFRLSLLILLLTVGGLLANTESSAAGAPTESATATERQEFKFPTLQGRSLTGAPLSTAAFAGKRLIILCFNPGLEQAKVFAQAMAKLAEERSRHNFELVGVAMGLSADGGRSFAEKLELDFPIFDDSDAAISGSLGLRSPLVLLGIDSGGYVGLTMGSVQADELRSVALVEGRIRNYLRLPETGALPDGDLERRPMAPLFEAKRLGGGELFRLADLEGKPVVLVFFLHTCPHCHLALHFFKDALAKFPEAQRPVLVGVSMHDDASAVYAALRAEKLDFFPVLSDSKRKIRDAYGIFAGSPISMFIGGDGRIVHRIEGWSDKRAPAMAQMYLARMAKTEVPMLLDPNGFSGNDACAACHPAQTATWEFTSHAIAYDTLVTHGAEHDPECVGCHVVGFEKPGGYSLDKREKRLEGVGCETCHGRGGPHLTPPPRLADAPGSTDYRSICNDCHTPTHSLGFDYETFAHKISHAAITQLSTAEREDLLAGRGKPRDLLPTTSNIVGSKACKSCHESEYATWTKSPHARSVESLRKKRKDDESECLRCHVTGFGRPGGFDEEGRVRGQTDLARVGCESCHGPGEEHVKNEGKHAGDIIALGDKCDSCVILQICGTCHDDANDPGFAFEIDARIEAQRHGSK